RSNEQLLEARVAERTRDLAAANDRLLANEQQLQRMARHDPLTGLANRLLLDDRISHGLAVGRRNGTRLALLLIDLDGFKPINDEHGHAVGDQLLVVLADRLQRSVRAVDTVARLGGDEFVLVLEDLAAVEDGRQVAAKVVAEMSRPVVLEGRELLVSASAGLAFYPEDGEDAQTLLRRADEAMYEAKRAGRNTFRQVGQ
ncbi:MAG: sensor domain-containing diguanylate cyclase, partial [Azospira oryzae]